MQKVSNGPKAVCEASRSLAVEPLLDALIAMLPPKDFTIEGREWISAPLFFRPLRFR